MSLLLDALKQAEQNKKRGDEKNQDVAHHDPKPAQELSDDNLDNGWSELDVLPAFDLSSGSLEESMPVISNVEPAEKDRQNEQDLLVEEHVNVDDKAGQNTETEEVNVAESVDEPLSEPGDKNNHSVVVEPEQVAKSPAQQAQNNQGELQADVKEELVRQQDIEVAKTILQATSAGERKNSYLLLGVLVIALLLGVTLFFMFSDTRQQYNLADYEYPVMDGMMDAEWSTGQPGGESEQVGLVAQNIPAQTKVAKPEKKSKSSSDSVRQNSNPVVDSTAKFYADSEAGSFDSSSRVKVKVKKQSSAVTQDLLRAYSAYAKHNYVMAEQLYQRVLRHEPDNVDALLGLGAIAEQQGRLFIAQKFYQKVLNVEANHAHAQNALIRLQQGQKSSEKEALYHILIEKNPDNAQIQAALARFYVGRQRWRKAQEAYFKAVDLDSDNAVYHYNLAVCLDHLAKPAVALRYYRKALQLSRGAVSGIDRASVMQRIQQLQRQSFDVEK